MFEKYSASDGKISKESLKEAFTNLNVYTSDAEGFDELFIEFDLDSDGQIDQIRGAQANAPRNMEQADPLVADYLRRHSSHT